MKTRLLSSFAALVAILLLIPLASNAQTITTLLSQNFSSATFPPAGWSASNTASGNQTPGIGGGASVAWYHSTSGNGGVGGTYGSAVANGMDAYQYGCYGSPYNGLSINPITLTAPTVNLSGYPAGDSQFVDFDLFIPINAYQTGNNTELGSHFYVENGSSSFYDFTVHVTTDGTVSTGLTSPSDPAGYTASTYWRHYHIAIPHGTASLQLTFLYDLYYTPCYYGYWYADNIGITNVAVTNVDYKYLTVTGPTNINFGSVPVGQSAGPYYCDLANPNAVPLTLSSYVFGGANPGDFTLFRAPSTIPAGGKDSVGVIYTPHGSGSRAGTLTFSSNGAIPALVTLNLSGTGVVPTVSYSSTNMFRGVNIELTDTSSVQYLYVNSTGAVPLTFNGVTFYGVNANNYIVTHSPKSQIPGGGVDSIGVRFLPGIEGIPDAHMVVSTNAGNNPSDTVSLFGVGILPHLAIDSGKTYPLPLTVNFDSVKLGSDSTISVQLWNPGSDTIAIEKNYYESSDFDFSIVPISGTDTLIPPGGTQNIAITFTPLQQGHREAEIRIRTNIPHTETTPAQDTSSFIINVEGTGVPSGKLSITGPSTNGNVSVGKSGCVTDTLWNTGAASITVNSLAISGTNASDFTVSGFTSGLVIGANSYATFQLCADPSMMGAATGLLTATGTSSETPATATLNLAVFGTLIADTGIIKQSFMSQSCGLDTELISVANTGNVTDTFVANPLVGTNSGDFSVTPSTPQIEAGGDTAKYIVIFSGANAGENASLLVTGGAAPLSFPLAASAGAAVIAGLQAAPMTAVGATSAAFTVMVSNTGSCPWTSGATVTVDPQFTYVSGAGTITGGGSVPFTFTYTPTSESPNSYPVTFPGSTPAGSSINVSITTAADAVQPASASNGYSLEQNYPNPFNGTSQLTMTLPVGALVHLSIIDVQGQVVETLLNQHYDAGSFSVTMDASQLASGTYYYQMNANGVTLTRQMVVVK